MMSLKSHLERKSSDWVGRKGFEIVIGVGARARTKIWKNAWIIRKVHGAECGRVIEKIVASKKNTKPSSTLFVSAHNFFCQCAWKSQISDVYASLVSIIFINRRFELPKWMAFT